MATMKGLKLDDFQHVGASYFARQHTTSRSAAKAALPSQAFAFQFPGECDARCARAYVYLIGAPVGTVWEVPAALVWATPQVCNGFA